MSIYPDIFVIPTLRDRKRMARLGIKRSEWRTYLVPLIIIRDGIGYHYKWPMTPYCYKMYRRNIRLLVYTFDNK